MATDRTSRYAATARVSVTFPDGEAAELIAPRRVPRPGAVFRTVPDDTDRLDLLAERYYRDPLKFWRIADAAPEMDPFDMVVPGRPLLVPPNR